LKLSTKLSARMWGEGVADRPDCLQHAAVVERLDVIDAGVLAAAVAVVHARDSAPGGRVPRTGSSNQGVG
jgi:predicted nicotinamide N-methyase